MQVAGLTGPVEELDRLLGGRDTVGGAVQQQQRPRGNLVDEFLGAELEHADRGFGRELVE